uniref:Sushi domain-containing protein n=1 Tax=Salarias fasciatus TaxID=181472 RepID=A0A672IQN6_SALFA
GIVSSLQQTTRPCTVDTEAKSKHNIQFKYSLQNKLYLHHNDEVEFVCKSGRPAQGSHMRGRCLDGEILCSKVPDIPHGHVSEETKKSEYQEGDVIHFSCDAGYIADLTSKYVCTSEGWLVIRRGTCYSCATLPDVPDAHVAEETRRDEYREGDVVHFTCDLGHSSELIIKYLCTSEGWLAVRRGSCNLTASSCEFPPAPEDLRIKGLPENQSPIRPDHILTFSCDGPGKYLLGSSVLICGRDGQWNNPFPSCTGNDQGVEMEEGTDLVRHERIANILKCSLNLIVFLFCHHFADSMCGSPPSLPGADTIGPVKEHYRHGEKIHYMCHNYHIVEGAEFKTCISGEWTGHSRCLKPCVVEGEAMINRSIKFKYSRFPTKMYLSHNDEVAFICARGRHGNALEMRQRCVDGVLHLPSCR